MKKQNNLGFTIIELLVVIVVIGILAAITIVSYVGVQQRARDAVTKAELNNAKTKLAIYYAENGDSYPDTLSGLGIQTNPEYTYNYGKTSSGYCISMTLNSDNTQKSHILSSNGVVESGGCIKTWKQLTSGRVHTCGITSDDMAYCWGRNTVGQLGNNSTTNSSSPYPIYTGGLLNGKTIKSISTAAFHTCVIASDNEAYCWGQNSYGALGNNSTSQSLVPVLVQDGAMPEGSTIKKISVGTDYTCAIASNNLPYCWGQNGWGQLGDNSTANSSVPVQVYISGELNGKTVSSIATGERHTCVIASDSYAYCWGDNATGQLGDSTGSSKSYPVAVYRDFYLSGLTVKSVTADYFNTCVLASDNYEYCWGYNNTGQNGNNSTSMNTQPIPVYKTGVLNGKTILSISTGEYNNCAIASNSLPYCWGSNNNGQIGDNSITQRQIPTAITMTGVLSGKTMKSILSGYTISCVIASDDNAYCWGNNEYGQLGNGTTIESHVPVAVQEMSY